MEAKQKNLNTNHYRYEHFPSVVVESLLLSCKQPFLFKASLHTIDQMRMTALPNVRSTSNYLDQVPIRGRDVSVNAPYIVHQNTGLALIRSKLCYKLLLQCYAINL